MISYRSTFGMLLIIGGAIAIGAGEVGAERGGVFEGTLASCLGGGMVVYGVFLIGQHFFTRP
ncbi:MAG: hypothetical protein AB7F75_01720 [Planctomycetota bacterium]